MFITDIFILYFNFIGLCLFFVGIVGIISNRYNILIVLISIEFILLSLNFFFILIALYLDDIVGFFFFFFLLSLAGAEAALGLSFVILFYSLSGLLNLRYLNLLKGI